MVEREREALASASAAASAQEASEEREMGMGMEMGYEDDMNATGLMRTQQGWSIERSLDDSRPTSSRSQTHSRGQSPHPFFAMPSTASSTSHPSGFSAAFGGNMNGGFGSYNGFTGMGGMNGMGGNSQFNAGLMLRRPSSVPLPTGDWLASFHNGASSSHSQSQSNFGAGYAGDLGNGVNGMQFGEIDPLAPIQSGYSYHGHGHVNSHSHSHAQNHGHGHMHAHAGEVDPLSIISGDYSMAIDSMSMSMDPMGMGVDSISMSMSMSMDPMGMAMDGYSMEMLHAPKAERTGRVEFCEDE
ncbi:hypothetical protein CPB83DRAFT_88724 [Crepidotus variabilis]|uniref:Uncharacterized protein n=1 Tax=Crepidotus variabilis TaxID=179855 RepID=A0A9P6JJ05_9AGAR|nr:hypothetical protein CPB83DRAFT_88724 [Crepidotus variabilis]